MPKAKLDTLFCLTATCPAGKNKVDYWDTIISGFVLECRASGGKTYALRYVDEHGTQRQHKIGGYHDITFDQARKKARTLKSEVTLGGNPAVAKTEKKAIPTLDELADEHLAFAKTYQKDHASTEMILRRHVRPKWGKLRINQIETQEIAKWLAEKRETGLAPATVEKIRMTLNRSFELAAKWNIPGGQQNPVRAVQRVKYNNKKERFLTAEEVGRLLAATERSPNTQLKAIVQLLLLTGARKSELLRARWSDINLTQKAWHIPTTKTGKPRYVPLSQAAIDVIGALPKWEKCSWLIPNPETREPFVTVKRAWQTARDEAKVSDLRLHDLRHSAASFMINAGINLYAVGNILGHADYQSTMRYSHLANDTLLAAVEAGAAKMQTNQP
jgi:integrase